jgi:hypothetical protein
MNNGTHPPESFDPNGIESKSEKGEEGSHSCAFEVHIF